MDTLPYMIRRRRQKKSKLYSLLLLIIILGGTSSAFLNGGLTEDRLITPLAEMKEVVTATFSSTKPSSSLIQAVEESLAGTKGTYAVVIKDLESGETYTQNESRVFQPGSLYKLWVMATAFEKMKDGTLKETETLKATIPELNERFDIASESAELTEGEVEMTVAQALSQMITISHNYAALLLSSRIRLANVEDFLQKNSLTHSKLGQPPRTSASDVAVFFEKLYKGELADKEYTERMLTLLKAQRLNNKLPLNLPEEVVIAHKTGELGSFTHDAGIVYTPKRNYLIVILSESTNPAVAEERIAEVSEKVHSYFLNK